MGSNPWLLPWATWLTDGMKDLVPSSGNGLDGCSSQLGAASDQVFGLLNKVPGNGDLATYCKDGCADTVLSAFQESATQMAVSGTCPYLNSTDNLARMAQSAQQFACYGTADGQSGYCLSQIAEAMPRTGVGEEIWNMDPSLVFTGDTLDQTCEAFAPTGCCFRTWAYLQAGFARQLCMNDLADEYLSLPGRCNVGVRACLNDWESTVQPLLVPVADCGSPEDGRKMWLGESCSTEQLKMQGGGYTSSCDILCGLNGNLDRPLTPELPSPPSDEGEDDCCKDWVIAYISVLSALAVILLVAFIVWRWVVYKKKQARRACQKDGDGKGTNGSRGLPPGMVISRGMADLEQQNVPVSTAEEDAAAATAAVSAEANEADTANQRGGVVLQRVDSSASASGCSSNLRFVTPRTSIASSMSRAGTSRTVQTLRTSTSVSRADSFHSATSDRAQPANSQCLIQ